MRKSNGENSLVTTEEAKEITAEHRICRDASWEMSRSSRGDHTQQTFTCYSAPEDEFGMTTKGLLVEGTYTFGMRTKREKITLTLWQNDKATQSRDRVVQLESRRPLNKKGKQTDLNWPHIHFGKERTVINESELGETIDVARAAKMFGKKSNISFDPELQDPNALVLLP